MGYDVVSAHEVKMQSRFDEEQVSYAIKDKRAMLTCNISHFTNLARKCYENKISHFGIIVTPQLDFKEMLKRTINLLDNNSSDDLKDRYIWL
jgi:hypothetical protein